MRKYAYYFACLNRVAIGLTLLLGFILIYCHAQHVEAEKTEGEVVVGAHDAIESGDNRDCVKEVLNNFGPVHDFSN